MSRSRQQVIWDYVQEWIREAEGDLRAAAHLLSLQQEDYFVVAFHAQQAAEKFLKALLVRYQIPFPKTHDIDRLLDLLRPVVPELKDKLASSGDLTPYGVEFRYPDQPAVDEETARQAVETARSVRDTVIEYLRDYLAQRPKP
jgi:HEPN domain-containing protein